MSYLLDSNLIIYAGQASQQDLRDWITHNTPFVSIVSKVETLGYQNLRTEEKQFLEDFFEVAPMLSLTDEIAEKATLLRQASRLSLGDSLISATAIVHNLTLATANTKDFTKVKGLNQINPLK